MLNEVCDAPEEIVDAGQAKDQRRRSRLEAECFAEFKPTADLSTYRRGKSVRTTRATAHYCVLMQTYHEYETDVYRLASRSGSPRLVLANSALTIIEITSFICAFAFHPNSRSALAALPLPTDISVGLNKESDATT
jgi:hypothetical protein